MPKINDIILVSPEDIDLLEHDWYLDSGGYPRATLVRHGSLQRLHEVIGRRICETDQYWDHANRNKLDNRRENLRPGNGINMFNRHYPNALGRGISRHGRKFRAVITKDKKRIRIGSFDKLEDAQQAYNNAAIELYGFIPE